MPGETAIFVDEYLRPSPKPERIVERESMRPLSTLSKKYSPPKIGNPTPLGLSAFAISMTISAIYDTGILGIDQLDLEVGFALFTGGLVQFAAGMWEFKVGNTFGGTGFSAYGGFWASWGIMYLRGFGIREAFAQGVADPKYIHSMGVFLLAWTIFTIIFTLATLRTNMGVLLAFVLLSVDFVFLTLSNLLLIPSLTVVGGAVGIACSVVVWYCLAAVLLTPDLSPISLPLWDLSHKNK